MEKSRTDHIKQYAIPAAAALIQWVIWQALGIGRAFLTYDIRAPYVWIQKGLFLFLLVSLWCFLFYVIRKAKAGDEKIRRGLTVFAVYFSISAVVLLLLWPGTWYWDDIGVLASAKNFDLLPWQHVLSAFFQTLFLQFFPVPGGIIAVQLLIVSVIVAYAVTDLELSLFKGKSITGFRAADILIELIPFFLPPVLLYQYSGFRMGLYIFIEIFVLSFIICISIREREISCPMLFFFALASAVVTTWRTEGFLYAPVIIVMLVLQKKEMLSAGKKIFTVGVMLAVVFMISSFQKSATGNDDYSVVTFLRPLSEVVRAADPGKDADLLEKVNRVVDTGVILDNPDVNGEDLLWKYDLPIHEYTDEEYSDFMKAFIGLCVRYPKAVAKERIKVFIDTSAIRGRTNPTNVTGAYYLFDPDEQNDNQREFNEWEIMLNRPVSETLRQRFILFLGCLREDFSERITYRLVWDTIIPLGIIGILWVGLAVKKKWKLFIAMSAVALRIPVLFLTAPATWTMYYLSFYLIGYVSLVFIILKMVSVKNDRKTEPWEKGRQTAASGGQD
ncbi:MAG: hypothetical protein K6G42_01180 [Lachnospiraceae bacterium]|nr:hypothetical protein [Lachnospiraceae bacterium]